MTNPSAPSATTGPRVAVIGGGIAGLAAALEATDRGAQVIVCESETLGGKLRTSSFAGRNLDEGADAFLVRVPDARNLAERVGVANQLVAPATGKAYVHVDNALQALPASHVLGIPTDPQDPNVRALVGQAGVAALEQDMQDPGAPPPALGDETIGAFIRRRLGDAIAERLVGPLIGGINAGNIDALSLAAVASPIEALARSSTEASLVRAAAAARADVAQNGPVFAALPDGMASLVDAITSALRAKGAVLHEHVTVRSLERLNTTWRIVADDPNRGGVATQTTFEADAVIVATPAGPASALIQDHAPFAGVHLGAISYASVALLALSYSPDNVKTPMNGSGFLVPRSQGLLCTAASWSSSKWAHLGPEHGDGTVVLRASAGRADDRRVADMDDAQLTERIVDELAKIMHIIGPPTAARLTRWPSSFPQYAPGHLARMDEVDEDLTEHVPTLAVAGCALRGVGIPASIASGRKAAASALNALERNAQ